MNAGLAGPAAAAADAGGPAENLDAVGPGDVEHASATPVMEQPLLALVAARQLQLLDAGSGCRAPRWISGMCRQMA